jgi:hypothetical protein
MVADGVTGGVAGGVTEGVVDLRPRVGMLHRADGEAVPLVIHPTLDPLLFEAETIRGEDPRPLGDGDVIWVDSIAPRQRIAVAHVALDSRQLRHREVDEERGYTRIPIR